MIRFLQKSGQTTKYVLGGLLLIICASMVITLIPGGMSGEVFGGGQPGKGIVAKVEGGDITADEVRQTARQMLQQQMPQGGANMSMLLPFFAQRAAEQLIMRQLLLGEAQQMGLRATTEEVKDELQHGRYAPMLFPGGNFIGQQEYEQLLQRNNLTAAKFENEVVKQDILISKLQAVIAGGATVSESEIRDQFVKQNSKVKFDYAILKQDDIKKGLHPTDEELKAFYESHKASYANSIPEKRKVKYAVLDTNKAEASIKLTEDDLRSYYNQYRDQYRTPEQVKVSHILIKTPPPGADGKEDPKAVAEARQRAEDLLKQIKGGANFEDIAKKYSEDSTAKQGGSIGWVGKGQTVPEFEKVAFSLPKGQISDLVKSSFGFHIIRVDDKHDAQTKSLDEVKDQIEPILKRQRGQQVVQKEADDLLKQARAQGLDAASAAQSIPVITSEFFTRRDTLPGMGPSPQFMDAVFAEADKAPPDVAPVSQGMVVFQLVDVKPAATPAFEEIRSRVDTEFKNERSNILLTQKSQELSDRAKAEHDLKRAAKELGATVKTSDFVLPDGQVPEVGSMTGQASVAFTMKPGEISGPITSGANGVVLSVIENQKPDETEYAAKHDQIRDALLQGKQQELFSLFASNLREQMEKSGKVKINQDEMKALTRSGSEPGM